MERIGSYIPNAQPASATKLEAETRARRNSDGSASSGKGSQSGSKKLTRSMSTPQSGRRGSGGGTGGGQTPTPGSEEGGETYRKNKVWKMIMSNINRSVDELYYLCEDERDEIKCREVISFLERAGHDFDKLIDRIGEQMRFETHQTQGVSWEVRKPTSSTYLAEVSVTASFLCSFRLRFRVYISLFPLLSVRRSCKSILSMKRLLLHIA
jgi:hypothetical protein